MSPAHEQMIGKVLRDKWHVDGLLGEGGMATVFAATHRNGMRGAIKMLRPELGDNDGLRKRLIREGYVANRIGHPGAVRVLDDDVTDDGRAFIVMELLEGDTWKAKWTRSGRRLPPREVLDVAARVLDILRAAHDAGIVHRDVKPDNVFITTDGAIKLLDFGIARLRESSADQTQTGSMLGTPAFMSPEQALAKWSLVDARSDLFALGATMWTLMTSRLVHVAETVPELLVAAATRQAPSFETVFKGAPRALVDLVDGALSFEPERRFQTAAAMATALERAKSSIGDFTVPSTSASGTDAPFHGGTIRMGPEGEAKEHELAEPSLSVDTVSNDALEETSIEIEPAKPLMAAAELSDAGSKSFTAAHTLAGVARKPASFGSGIALGSVLALAAAGGVALFAVSRLTPTPAQNPTASSPPPNDVASAAPTSVPSAVIAPITPSASASAEIPAHRKQTLKPFDGGVAQNQLVHTAVLARSMCRGEHGPESFVYNVTFEGNGRARVGQAMPFEAGLTAGAACARSVLSGSTVPPFDGPEGTATVSVTLDGR